jgi:hypothetical protein
MPLPEAFGRHGGVRGPGGEESMGWYKRRREEYKTCACQSWLRSGGRVSWVQVYGAQWGSQTGDHEAPRAESAWQRCEEDR